MKAALITGQYKELKAVLSEAEYKHVEEILQLDEDLTQTVQINPLTGIGSQPEHKKINKQIRKKLRQINKPVRPADA